MSKLEAIIIEHALSEDERTCSECGSVADEFKVETTRIIKMVPAHLVVEEHRRQVYICRPCSKQNAQDGSVSAQFLRADMSKLP